MADKPWIVFAGGGTGGHLYPALSVVEWLRVGEAVDVSFFCTQRPIDREILGRAGLEAIPLTVQAFPTRPWRIPGFWLRWRQSVSQCKRAFRRRRPGAVIGAGGYASGPPVHAALQMGIPTFLLNPDAVPGRANRHFACKKGLTGIFAQWGVTRRHLPEQAPVLVVGCPVRSSFSSVRPGPDPVRSDVGECLTPLAREALNAPPVDARAARASFDLDPNRPTLLVTGASQGARTINDALMLLAPQISSTGWQVLHLSGAADRDRITEAYAAAGVRHTVLAFTDRMPEAMAAADLIVSRAGASSLAEILAIGKPSILLPYPFHRDRHQWHNGEVLVEAGAAVMIEDHKDGALNARELEPLLSTLLQDESRRNTMAEAARSVGRPHAALHVAEALAVVAQAAPGTLIRLIESPSGNLTVRQARYEVSTCVKPSRL